MINKLLEFVMFIINALLGIIMTPIDLLLQTAFPSVLSAISHITDFFDLGFTYFSFFLKLFMIPKAPLVLYLSIVSAILVFNITIRAYSLIISAYRTFKP